MKFWKYEQSTGKMFTPAGVFAGQGYAGHGEGKNNHSEENIRRVGPIPCGFYDIGEPFDSVDHGPYAMRLTPFPETNTFGRDEFMLHGDSKEHPGCASLGCVVQGPVVRHLVGAARKDKDEPCTVLEVVP